MNDRFDAQLREHLLATADTKPADGQLGRVAAAVGGTPQRHPVVARLTWGRGGGSGPSRSVQYGLIAVVLAGAAIGALALSGGTSPSPTRGPVSQATEPPTAEPTVVETPVPAVAVPNPTDDPSSTCIGFNSPTDYTQRAGTLPITVTVPASATEGWSGYKDTFRLVGARCESDGSPDVQARLLAHLNADACHWQGSSIEAPTAFDLGTKLPKVKGVVTTDSVDAQVGPFQATRIDISVPAGFDASACDDGAITLWDGLVVDPGWTVQVYVAEVDGVTLVVTASYPTDRASSVLAAIDTIVGSVRIDM